MGLSLYLSVALICIFQVGDIDSISGHSLKTSVWEIFTQILHLGLYSVNGLGVLSFSYTLHTKPYQMNGLKILSSV